MHEPLSVPTLRLFFASKIGLAKASTSPLLSPTGPVSAVVSVRARSTTVNVPPRWCPGDEAMARPAIAEVATTTAPTTTTMDLRMPTALRPSRDQLVPDVLDAKGRSSSPRDLERQVGFAPRARR